MNESIMKEIEKTLRNTLKTTFSVEDAEYMVKGLESWSILQDDGAINCRAMSDAGTMICAGIVPYHRKNDGAELTALEDKVLELERYTLDKKVKWYVDIVIKAAEAAHEANRVYCESIGDNSQVRWAGAPDWQQESAVKGVLFKIQNPAAEAEDMHESWCVEKERTGWIYGDKKCAERKTHPCLVPYQELPQEQQVKDSLFSAVVTPFLPDQAEY